MLTAPCCAHRPAGFTASIPSFLLRSSSLQLWTWESPGTFPPTPGWSLSAAVTQGQRASLQVQVSSHPGEVVLGGSDGAHRG